MIKQQLEIANDPREMPEVRQEAGKLVLSATDRFLDLVHYPKRPAMKGGGDDPVDIRKLLDITPQVTPGPGPGPA